jgi:small subunit ribosomal protein S17
MVQRVIQGTVVSDKMDKTVVVAVERRKKHPLYHKVMTTTSRFKAHDEANACRLGDVVRIIESRPLSRDKRWRVIEVLTRGDVAEVAPETIGREIEESVATVRDDEEGATQADADEDGEDHGEDEE